MNASPVGAMRRIVDVLRARRTALLALGAIAFGAVAVLGARNYIAERLAVETARLQPRHEAVDVVVAKRDLRRGEAVGPDTMAVRSVPREYAPAAAIVPARFDTVAGTRLLVAMKAGEPLLPSAVAQPDAGAISSRVRPGVRAMTIAVDEVNSLSGMLQPGDRIDLLLSVRPPSVGGPPQPEVTRTVMQGVPVMATGRQSRAAAGDEAGPHRPYTSITVEVDPEQAQRLVVAQRSGKLTAVLRNPEDRQPIGDRRVDLNTVLGLPAPQVAVAPVPVEVIVGGRGQAPSSAAPGAAASAPMPAPEPPVPGAAARGARADDASARRPPGGDGAWIPAPPATTPPLHR